MTTEEKLIQYLHKAKEQCVKPEPLVWQIAIRKGYIIPVSSNTYKISETGNLFIEKERI